MPLHAVAHAVQAFLSPSLTVPAHQENQPFNLTLRTSEVLDSSAGEPLPIKRTWLADVVTVLLECARRRNLLGSNVSNQDVMSQLDESARQLTVKWNEQLEIFWAYLHRHLKALAAVCVMANEVRLLPSVLPWTSRLQTLNQVWPDGIMKKIFSLK